MKASVAQLLSSVHATSP